MLCDAQVLVSFFLWRAQYLAREAWRVHYGQIKIQQEDADDVQHITFALRSGRDLKLKGWQKLNRDGKDIYMAPNGQEFDELGMTEEAVRQARDAPDGSMAVANAAFQRLTGRTMRGEGVRTMAMTRPTPTLRVRPAGLP